MLMDITEQYALVDNMHNLINIRINLTRRSRWMGTRGSNGSKRGGGEQKNKQRERKVWKRAKGKENAGPIIEGRMRRVRDQK